MSVLIKDMEKPEFCYAIIDGEFEYCPFVNTDDDCVLLLKKGICERTWQGQYSKCPLVEASELCDDAVSRREAIDAIGEVHPLDYNAQAIKSRIEKLPPVQPKTCEDTVSRKELLKFFSNNGEGSWTYDAVAIGYIKALPSVAPERKTMICGACSHSDSESLYATNPPKIQCRKTGNLHFTTDYCDCENENEKVRNI